jgi:ABC-type amino acid transport substrate-binding protein
MPNKQTKWQWLAVCLIGAFSCTAFAAAVCNGFDPGYDDIATLKKAGIVRIAVHDQEPPASWRDEHGVWHGSIILLTQNLVQQLGVKTQYIPLRYHDETELATIIRQNQADLAAPNAGLDINSLAELLISHPYATRQLAILFPHTRYGAQAIQPILQTIDANADKIGALDNQQEMDYLRTTIPHAKIKRYRTTDVLVVALQHDRVSAVIGDAHELTHWLNAAPVRHLHYRLILLPHSQKGISLVTGPRHWRLMQWLNVALDQATN